MKIMVFFINLVLPRSESMKLALDANNFLGLLFTLVGFTFSEKDVAKEWVIPSSLGPYKLEERIEVINEFIDTPFMTDSGKPAISLLKKKTFRKQTARVKGSKQEEPGNFLSAEFIEDSDDFDDDAFFLAEAERRKRYASLYEPLIKNDASVAKQTDGGVVTGGKKDANLKDNEDDDDDELFKENPPFKRKAKISDSESEVRVAKSRQMLSPSSDDESELDENFLSNDLQLHSNENLIQKGTVEKDVPQNVQEGKSSLTKGVLESMFDDDDD